MYLMVHLITKKMVINLSSESYLNVKHSRFLWILIRY
nr:MAG TPA: hypothetical protein [Bacteriophage sp.]